MRHQSRISRQFSIILKSSFKLWFVESERQKRIMTKKTPKGPIPSLIGSTNGRPRRAEVKRLSYCYRCNDDILAGSNCIEIPKLGAGFASVKRVCETCFEAIMQKTAQDLEQLQTL